MPKPNVPLVMFPDGSLARSEVVPEGCILVEEPDEPEEVFAETIIDDQTEAVNGNQSRA